MEGFIGFIVVTIFAIIIIILFKNISKSTRSKNIDKNYFKGKWQEIKKVSQMNNEMGFKMAIIEADKLLDEALKHLGTAGSTMGERLKVICYKYPNLKKVWGAHSIRNNISHESGYVLYNSSAKKALDTYEQAFRELGIL